jgi:serine/threonine protein kinase
VKVTSSEHATVAWLLHKVRFKHARPDQVIGMRTACNSEVLDAWLQDETRVLYPLRSQEELIVLYRRQLPRRVGNDHFEGVKVIGNGGFSSVVLGNPQPVRKRDTGRLYADKKLDVSSVLSQGKAGQVYNEREVLTKLDSPFVIKLSWAFQTVRG